MSFKTTNLKLALVLAFTLLGPAACNNQKAEQVEEEETADAQSDGTASPTRDNRSSQSGDAAFIKIFPDGDVVPTRGESATVSAPATTPAPSTTGSSTTAAPASETTASAPAADDNQSAPSQPVSSTPVTESTTPASGHEAQPTAPASETQQPTAQQPAPAEENQPEPVVVNEPAPAPAPVVINEPAPAPAPAPVVINEPAPAPAPAPADPEDNSRPVLAVNESTAAQIISVLPKESKAIVAIGKHKEFVQGPYMILAKWTNDSKKVKVNVTSEEAKDKNCAIDEAAAQGEWKPLGIFYLTDKAKVVITNPKNSNYAVKNELMLKPVVADHLTSPSKFKCLGGQIDGQGLVAFP